MPSRNASLDRSPEPSSKSRPTAPRQSTPTEVVDPVWLLKALAISFAAALLCAWFTVCLLFYQGEWQLVLHPSKTVDQTPASSGIPFEAVRFDAGESGQPRLTAWWIPAQSPSPVLAQPARYAASTILYLHDGSLSLSASLPALTRLHELGLNVFAIDYRGFGQSDPTSHPTEARMTQDTAAALDYLTTTRHIPASTIIPYSVGLAASLAANLAAAHRDLPAVILDNPDPNPTATAVAAYPSHVLPVRLLFRERFDIATPLANLATPKLLIAGGPNPASPHRISALQTLFRRASSPTLAATLPPTHSEDAYRNTLARFLDEYAHTQTRSPASTVVKE